MQLKQFFDIAIKVSSRKKCYYFWWSTWLLILCLSNCLTDSLSVFLGSENNLKTILACQPSDLHYVSKGILIEYICYHWNVGMSLWNKEKALDIGDMSALFLFLSRKIWTSSMFCFPDFHMTAFRLQMSSFEAFNIQTAQYSLSNIHLFFKSCVHSIVCATFTIIKRSYLLLKEKTEFIKMIRNKSKIFLFALLH